MLVLRKKNLGAEHPDTTAAMANLGFNHLKQKNHAEAEPLLRECLAIREKTQPKTWLLANTQSLLGEALAGQAREILSTDPVAAAGTLADAEPLLLSGYDGLKARAESIPVPIRTTRLTEALQRLIDLYSAWDKPTEVTRWRKELEAGKAAGKEASNP